MNDITIEKLKKLANTYYDFSCEPAFKKFPQGYVIDEEKSVRWNREQVEKNHNDYDEEYIRLRQEKNKLFKNFETKCYEYLIQKANIGEKQASNVFDYLDIRTDNLIELVNELDDIIKLFV